MRDDRNTYRPVQLVKIEEYLRLVPEAKLAHLIPDRVGWGVGDYVYFVSRESPAYTRVRDAVKQFHSMGTSYFLQPAHGGIFIEFKDATAATMFRVFFG